MTTLLIIVALIWIVHDLAIIQENDLSPENESDEPRYNGALW